MLDSGSSIENYIGIKADSLRLKIDFGVIVENEKREEGKSTFFSELYNCDIEAQRGIEKGVVYVSEVGCDLRVIVVERGEREGEGVRVFFRL